MRSERGFALITVLMLMAMLSAMLSAYFVLTRVEMSTTKSSMDGTRGFYAAEAGLNLRAEEIRQLFIGFNRPSGTSPTGTAGALPCLPGDLGSGDFACKTYGMTDREVRTLVAERAGNPTQINIPPGEPFASLNALEYAYDVRSVSVSGSLAEALLEMRFKSRLVPLFQFAAFYNKDLEITPGPPMTLSGAIHSNFDIYAAADTTVDVDGQITSAGVLYRGRKEADICWTGPFRVMDPLNPTELPTCSGTRRLITQPEVAPWNGRIRTGVTPVTVPLPGALDPVQGEIYWDNADLRLIYDVDAGTIQLTNPDHTGHVASAALVACLGGAATLNSNTFLNNRELDGSGNAKPIQMLEIDAELLLDCTRIIPAAIDGKTLDETSNGGLVWYLGVTGASQAGINDYGVRVRNGETLASTVPGAPDIAGLTVVSNQAMYINGHYNRLNKKPAAFLSDSMNILSEAWSAGCTMPNLDCNYNTNMYSRDAAPTGIYAAFLSGTDTTGAAGPLTPEGPQDSGLYSGGLHNFLRLHEDWRNVTLTYRGSLVSLNVPQHVEGRLVVGPPQYRPPNRDYEYDTDFDNFNLLPPLTPMFVYLRQELFVRDFEL